jgi:hypothetical protein
MLGKLQMQPAALFFTDIGDLYLRLSGKGLARSYTLFFTVAKYQ